MPPAQTRAVIDDAQARTLQIEREYEDGLVTDGERSNREVDIWCNAAELARLEARRQTPERDRLAACAASLLDSTRPDAMRSPRGSIEVTWCYAIGMSGTLGGGLEIHEFFMRAVEARQSLLAAAERRWRAYEVARDIDAAIGDVAVVTADCGTTRGMPVRALEYDEFSTGSLAARIEGSVLAADVRARDGLLLAAAGTLLIPSLARRIEEALVPSVVVRDVRSCEARDGVCARCLGLAPEDALWTCVGDRVGARAAATIGAALSRLVPRRVFHIC